jgi:uncharacterized protein YjbI with pentapeptide repeats
LEIAKMLVDDLIKLVDRLDRDGWEPRIIITGRDLLIQANERSFGEEGQVLILQPYRLELDSEEIEYQGKKALLEAPQLEQWWKTYLALKPGALPIPAFLSHGTFKELVEQPLLNFLMALTYLRGEADFGENANINNVYFDLMARVLDRPWGKHTHLKWTIEEFLEVMEEVATSAWHTRGDVRITSMSSVRKHCERNEKVHARILALESNPDAGYMRLMAAFYFRQDGDAVVDKTFEFTHKSFGEYLVARRIVTLARRIQKGLSNPEFYSIDQAKQEWLTICGEEEITEYIWPFLQRQVALEYQEKKEEAAKIQSTLSDLFSDFINKGFEPKGLTTNLDIIRASRNAESSLLLTISAFADSSKGCSTFRLKGSSHISEVVSRSITAGNSVFLKGLRNIEFPNYTRFGWSFLAQADFQNSRLYGAYFEGSKLTGANFSDANVEFAIFSLADLEGSRFYRANLSRSSFDDCYASGALFRLANLENSSFIRAGISDTIFTGANLSHSDLRYAFLDRSDFSSVSFIGAKLTGARFSTDNYRDKTLGTVLDGADMDEIEMHFIYVDDEKLEVADAYNYLKKAGAKNVSKPEGME